ncbi:MULTISPECIES: tyrosine-type recombinase/integrase [unclassified Ruegeria]|uniref:tyrosine-type recombinase/integrase n=1 Tax=unclassified Ruegeria TaxID=2625375 RepID=UPI001488F7DB|nr:MULTISPECIES: tyrosine-type recombinase/integrase [unclassified Ruegeria]
MGSIVERKRADGTTSFRAQILIKQDGKIVYQTSRTFDRRPTAKAWMDRKEKELKAPGGLDSVIKPSVTLGDAIDRYIDEQERAIGDTKAQVLRTIRNEYEISNKKCGDITSVDLVEFARLIFERPNVGSPSTVGNYMSHLSAVFDIAMPAWGMPLDHQKIKDAVKVGKSLGIISKSKSRDRRPTLDELDTLLTHFEERFLRGRSLPMHKVVVFAIFSTRRESEITRITWDDYEPQNSRVLVRDMKHPGEKIGNDTWCELPAEAMKVIDSMPRKNDEKRIFPYHSDTVSASFTRACSLYGIDDLRFHDLRHEGVSRLFEMAYTIPQAASVSGHRSWQSLQRYSHIRASGDRFKSWPWLDRVCEG